MIGKWMDFLARTQVIRLRYQLITSTCAALCFMTMYRRSPDLHLRTNPENACLRYYYTNYRLVVFRKGSS